jgi:hypothetical protein
MLRRVALVRSDVSEERSASIIRVTRIGVPGTTLAVNGIWHQVAKKYSNYRLSQGTDPIEYDWEDTLLQDGNMIGY